jgi:hypothetical protein
MAELNNKDKDKDPYGFEAARRYLSTKEGLERIKQALEKSAKEIEKRQKDRIVTEEQWRTVYNI